MSAIPDENLNYMDALASLLKKAKPLFKEICGCLSGVFPLRKGDSPKFIAALLVIAADEAVRNGLGRDGFQTMAAGVHHLMSGVDSCRMAQNDTPTE